MRTNIVFEDRRPRLIEINRKAKTLRVRIPLFMGDSLLRLKFRYDNWRLIRVFIKLDRIARRSNHPIEVIREALLVSPVFQDPEDEDE